MSESIIFRGTHVRYYDGRQEEGGAFVRIHLTSEFTTPVMDAMDWEEPGSSVTDAKLDGELHAINFILTPGDAQLAGHEIQFGINGVEDFKVVTIEKDEVKRRELRFVVRSSQAGVAAQVDEYIRRIGEHQGALKVSYTKQDELPLTEAAGDTKKKPGAKEKSGCKHCDAGIPTQDNDDAVHVNGRGCAKWEGVTIKTGDGEELFKGSAADLHRAAETMRDMPAPTAAEKKKARLAEEARKKQMRAESGVEAVQ